MGDKEDKGGCGFSSLMKQKIKGEKLHCLLLRRIFASPEMQINATIFSHIRLKFCK